MVVKEERAKKEQGNLRGSLPNHVFSEKTEEMEGHVYRGQRQSGEDTPQEQIGRDVLRVSSSCGKVCSGK